MGVPEFCTNKAEKVYQTEGLLVNATAQTDLIKGI
jgi:hypothetical protein